MAGLEDVRGQDEGSEHAHQFPVDLQTTQAADLPTYMSQVRQSLAAWKTRKKHLSRVEEECALIVIR